MSLPYSIQIMGAPNTPARQVHLYYFEDKKWLRFTLWFDGNKFEDQINFHSDDKNNIGSIYPGSEAWGQYFSYMPFKHIMDLFNKEAGLTIINGNPSMYWDKKTKFNSFQKKELTPLNDNIIIYED